jgi:CBS domain-containing protein
VWTVQRSAPSINDWGHAMAHREVGSENHELFAVHDVDGGRRVDCPVQARPVLFSECQACEHGTVVRLKGEELPFVLCPSEGAPHGLTVHAPDAPVSTVMRRLLSVPQELPVAELVRAMIDTGANAVLVTGAGGRAVGLVTKTDIVLEDYDWTDVRNALLSMRPPAATDDFENEDDVLLHELLRTRTAGDLMTGTVAYASASAAISSAAALMVRAELSHLPVLDEDLRPVGMLDALDIARWAIRPA